MGVWCTCRIIPLRPAVASCEISSQDDFVASSRCLGWVPGSVYKQGPRGLGYYRDGSSQTSVSPVMTTVTRYPGTVDSSEIIPDAICAAMTCLAQPGCPKLVIGAKWDSLRIICCCHGNHKLSSCTYHKQQYCTHICEDHDVMLGL